MRPRWILACAAAALLSAQAPAQVSPVSAEEVERFVSYGASGYRPHRQEPIDSWERDLREVLGGTTLAGAAETLGSRYGLSAPDMTRLIQVIVARRVRSSPYSENRLQPAEMRSELLALLAATQRAPLVLQVAADLLDDASQCSADFAALMEGSADPAADSWRIANATVCPDNWIRAAALGGDRAMPALIRISSDAAPEDALPLYQWLTGPAAFERIEQSSRQELLDWLYERHASLLFGVGLAERAVTLLESLPADRRSRVLNGEARDFTAAVDGLPVTIRRDEPNEALKLDLAITYALEGRAAEARAVLTSMRELAPARRTFACLRGSGERRRGRCLDNSGWNWVDIVLLEHFLDRPLEDPYLLAEAGLSDHPPDASTPAAELRCRLFPRSRFPGICPDRPSRFGRERDASVSLVLDQLALPGFAAARQAAAADLQRVAAAQQPERGAGQARYAPAVVTQEATPFPEMTLPEAFQGERPPAVQLSADLVRLPEGFNPVRLERDGERAVAISLARFYDPTGDVAQGAYWVHISDDGGRHWQRPLYTGLAHRFPYVVPASSRMPLLDGDRLNLEVEIDEADTATATHLLHAIPVPSRRRATGLYIQLPLDVLARDTDGDGFSDIAERRLLMDRPSVGSDTPYIVGSAPSGSCRRALRRRHALAPVLETLLQEHDPGLRLFSSGRRSAGVEKPIFIEGNPDDYRCLRPNRLIIVYREGDFAELKRFRAEFRALTISPIIYNRARDRAYVTMDGGLEGGTYRLRLVDGAWTVERISSWVV